ncbi:bacillithiol biosynthesis deacetylase BshB1 [Aneurinibacillus sp. Ricciae_BoGa-3]|uniref:bacillithiol biosynthesis deacetylase BshB1 n=1 Tax=Aneurinibacillus sp. Ricciae_BoGa-3 TaxID=3022697 RepID=UPI00234254D2|nr:bacillithiol biosynthesis deacetylase BshB1 [Aneurinibacillus sp. Ricciae_BoGa-3]WCK56105.1 bacillithiol biosynthesis deacetylase BshB1 [Aneurinibacillus sp. Ricciae_BoGa-3]
MAPQLFEEVDILAFGAHPDDVEIGAGGVLHQLARQGKKVVICDLTLAELSSNGTVERRQQEAAAADRQLGIYRRVNLGLPDRGLRMSDEHIRPLVQVIRTFRPATVFAPFWKDRHPDHEMCAALVKEAVFNAKIRKYEIADGIDSLPAHQVGQLFHYFINDSIEPQFMMDISEDIEAKMAALASYRSQFEISDGSVATPLTEGYLKRVRAREYGFGQAASVAYAEGFVASTPLLLSVLPGKD